MVSRWGAFMALDSVVPEGPGKVAGEVGSEVGEQVGVEGEAGGDEVGGKPMSALHAMVSSIEAPLSTPEYRKLEDEFARIATAEDLKEPYRGRYEALRGNSAGVCSKCRWQHGCLMCDEVKMWEYACRQTLYEALDVRVRPKAKPRGRPKKS